MRERNRFQFSLASFLLAVGVMGIAINFAPNANRTIKKERILEQKAVSSLKEIGGYVSRTEVVKCSSISYRRVSWITIPAFSPTDSSYTETVLEIFRGFPGLTHVFFRCKFHDGVGAKSGSYADTETIWRVRPDLYVSCEVE